MDSRPFYLIKWKHIFLYNLYYYIFLKLNKCFLPLILKSTTYLRRFDRAYFCFILLILDLIPDLKKLLS